MAGGILSLKLGLNSKGFRTGLRVARSAVSKMRKNISKQFKASMKSFAAGFGMSWVKDQIGQTIEWAGKIDSLATQYALTRKQVQGLEQALAKTGMSVESGLAAFKKMQIFARRATSEFKGTMRKNELLFAFEKLGISIEDIDRLEPYELFKKMATNMNGAAIGGATMTEAMNTLFGGDAQAMLEAFNGGLITSLETFELMGGAVSDDAISQLAEISAQWDVMKVKMNQTKAESVGFFSQMSMGLYHIADVGSQVLAEYWEAPLQGNPIQDMQDEMMGLKKDSTTPKEIGLFARYKKLNRERNEQYAKDLYHQEQTEKWAREDEKRQERINALAAERANIAKQINDIEATQEQRRFNALTDAQKQVELAKRLREEEEARKKLGKMDELGMKEPPKWVKNLTGFFTSNDEREVNEMGGHDQNEVIFGLPDKKSGALGIFGDMFKGFGKGIFSGMSDESLAGREARNLARMEADEKVAKTQEELKALKIEAKHKDFGGGIGSAFTNLSSIGGQLGAKSPLLTNAEKTLTLAEEQRKLLASIDKTMHIFGP